MTLCYDLVILCLATAVIGIGQDLNAIDGIFNTHILESP